MPRDEPDVLEILRSANDYLGDLASRMDGGDRYQLLCVQYLLDIVRRELTEGATLDSVENRRLMAFMKGQDDIGDSDLKTAYEVLARSISAGQLDDRLPEVLDLLMAHVENKVAISDPNFIELKD